MVKETIYTRSHNPEAIARIKDALAQGKPVEVHNQHETFYGSDFFGWLEQELADTNCTLGITEYDNQFGYARETTITPKELK